MDKELEKYYTERFSMMSSQGWKDLLEDIEVMRTNYKDINSVNTMEELHFRKGQLDILDWVSNLKEISERAYEDLQE